MVALTPPRFPFGKSIRRGLPSSRVSTLPDILSSTTTVALLRTSVLVQRGYPRKSGADFAAGSQARRWHQCHIMFTFIMVCQGGFWLLQVFAPSFPPHLAVTQLLQLLTGTTDASGSRIPPGERCTARRRTNRDLETTPATGASHSGYSPRRSQFLNRGSFLSSLHDNRPRSFFRMGNEDRQSFDGRGINRGVG